MAEATLKSLHTYLRLLENPSELKRKMPEYSNPRTIKEGLSEMSKLVGLDNAVFKDPQNIATVIGSQRFIMIWGEPSVTAHIARIFDSSRVLVTVLIDPRHFEKATVAQSGVNLGPTQKQTAAKSLSANWARIQNRIAWSFGPVEPRPGKHTREPETAAGWEPDPDLPAFPGPLRTHVGIRVTIQRPAGKCHPGERTDRQQRAWPIFSRYGDVYPGSRD